MKFLVTIYSTFFLLPLLFILEISNTFGFILLKIFLGFWMLLVFYQALKRYPQITLAPFLFFVGIFFTLWWVFLDSSFGFLFLFVILILFWGKFRHIDKLLKSNSQTTDV
jgi:hypothetical protein